MKLGVERGAEFGQFPLRIGDSLYMNRLYIGGLFFFSDAKTHP